MSPCRSIAVKLLLHKGDHLPTARLYCLLNVIFSSNGNKLKSTRMCPKRSLFLPITTAPVLLVRHSISQITKQLLKSLFLPSQSGYLILQGTVIIREPRLRQVVGNLQKKGLSIVTGIVVLQTDEKMYSDKILQTPFKAERRLIFRKKLYVKHINS